jgi:hypothetical protein
LHTIFLFLVWRFEFVVTASVDILYVSLTLIHNDLNGNTSIAQFESYILHPFLVFCHVSTKPHIPFFHSLISITVQAPTVTRIAALKTLGSYCVFAPTLARQWGDGFLAIAEDTFASPELRATAIGIWGRLGPQVYHTRRRRRR